MKDLLKSLKKLLKDIKKVINKIKRFLKGPCKFLEDGKVAGTITLGIVAGYFLYGWKIYSIIKTVPHIILILFGILIVFILNELFNYIFKLICKFDIKIVTYFVSAFMMLFINNVTANHRHLTYGAFITCLIITMSIYLCSTTLNVIFKRKYFKNINTYIILAISLLGVAFSLNFLLSDNFGKEENIYIEKTTSKEELKNGKYKVSSITYGKSKDINTQSIDLSSIVKRIGIKNKITNITSKYDYKDTNISGIIWYPTNKDNNETLFIVHGATTYVKDSYLGFDYLGEYLASYGYTVISINEDIVNELDTKNDIRTVLLLENIKTILKENNNKDSILYHKINEDKISLLGHSRGGEVVSLAYIFNTLKNHPDYKEYKFDYNFNIISLIALAPTVDQYLIDNKSIELNNVSYLLLHGSNDGDVSKVMGEKTYNNTLITKDNLFKAELYIQGANHGQFNSKWSKYDAEIGANPFINVSNLINEKDQKEIVKLYVKTFLDCTLKENTKNKELFINNTSYLKYLPDTVYINRYNDSSYDVLENYDNDTTSILYNNIKSHNIYKDNMGNGKDKENKVLEITYDDNSYIELNMVSKKISGIAFDIADKRYIKTKDSISYTVELLDEKGNTTSIKNPKKIYPTLAIRLYKEDYIFNNYEYRSQMQSVIIKNDMFNNKEFDFDHVTKLRIYFDKEVSGKVIIDNISTIK